jgi:hypothetical protein
VEGTVVSRFGGVMVSVLTSGLKVRGSNPAKAIDFRGDKIPQHAFLRSGSEAVGPMS